MPRRKKTYRRKSSALKKFIKKTVAKTQETKTTLLNYANSIEDSARTPLSNSIIDVDQGVTQSTRIGNSITVTSMKYDFFITGSDTTNSIRILMYIPKDPNSLIESLPFNQAPDLDAFTILRDFFVTTSSSGNNNVRKQGWLRFNRGNRSGMNIRYTGALGTTVTKNNLMIYMTSDSGAISDPQINGFVRLYYKDS